MRHSYWATAVVVWCLVLSVEAEFVDTPSEDFQFSLELSPQNYTLYWRHDNTSITLEIHAATMGWVGIGFSPHGGMRVSCLVLPFV